MDSTLKEGVMDLVNISSASEEFSILTLRAIVVLVYRTLGIGKWVS